jgi:hypothetical protein
LIDGRRKLLRLKEPSFLQRTRFSIGPLGHVEDDNMCMELWRHIAIDRAGCIVLKLGGDKFPCGLGRMIAADAGLRIVFQLVEGNANALSVRFADALIPADKGSERDRLGGGKGRIPPGSMFHRLDPLAVGILIFIGRSLPHKLLPGLWMLALAEFGEVFGRNRFGKAELLGEAALPLPCYDSALRPIVLFLRGELHLVVGLRLARGEWL